MKTIIAPTDFSDASLNALNYAADLAKAINAELVLVNVIQLPIPAGDIPLTEFEYEESTGEAEKKLATIAHELCVRSENKIEIHRKMLIGGLEYELSEFCKQHPPVAIVMATNASSTAESFFLGSYTISAIKHFKYPVLVVPHNASFEGIKRIALTVDMKEIESEKTISSIKNWLRIFNCKIDIVNIIDHANDNAANPAFIFLEHALAEFHPQFYFIENKNIQEGISQFAKENKPDLFITIQKEHRVLGSLFHKSKSKPFILRSHIPVLSIS